MKSLGNILAFTLILSLIAAIIYFMYQGSLLVWANIDVLSHSNKVILISAMVTMLLTALVLAFGMRSAAQIAARGKLAKRRHALYVHIFSIMRALIDKNSSASQQQLTEELARTHADFVIVASTASVKAYLAFQQTLEKGEHDLLEPCFQAVWKSLRKDLGFHDDFDVIDIKSLIAILPKQWHIDMYEKSILPR